MTPILSSVKDDVRDLAAVTFTPLYFITPDAANGTAVVQVMSLAFRCLGDEVRADLGQVRPMWVPPERYSLAERYDAAAKTTAAGVPYRSVRLDVLQFRPDVVARMEVERLEAAAEERRASGSAALRAIAAASLPPMEPEPNAVPSFG